MSIFTFVCQCTDIIFEDNPVMQTVLDAHKLHLRLQQARPHGTTMQDSLAMQNATLELVSMNQPLPDQALPITTLSFLGKKTIDDNEFEDEEDKKQNQKE